MAGRAKVRAVLSTATSRTGNISRPSASQSRQLPPGRPGAGNAVGAGRMVLCWEAAGMIML